MAATRVLEARGEIRASSSLALSTNSPVFRVFKKSFKERSFPD